MKTFLIVWLSLMCFAPLAQTSISTLVLTGDGSGLTNLSASGITTNGDLKANSVTAQTVTARFVGDAGAITNYGHESFRWFGFQSAINGGVSYFSPIGSIATASTGTTNLALIAGTSGVASNFYIHVSALPAGTNVLTLIKNTVPTAVTVTYTPATSYDLSDTTHTFTYVWGDKICISNNNNGATWTASLSATITGY